MENVSKCRAVGQGTIDPRTAHQSVPGVRSGHRRASRCRCSRSLGVNILQFYGKASQASREQHGASTQKQESHGSHGITGATGATGGFCGTKGMCSG